MLKSINYNFSNEYTLLLLLLLPLSLCLLLFCYIVVIIVIVAIIIIIIAVSNHIFGRAIWDKSPERIFENFEFFKNHEGGLPNHPNQTCSYWLITPN